MHSFGDKLNDSWDIELTIGIMEKVKDQLKIDLFDPISEERQLIAELAPIGPENIRLFFNMLYILCEGQCKEKEIASFSDFSLLMGSNSVKEAYEAFYQEWELFFQSLGRMDQAEAIRKMNSLIQEGVTEVVKRIKEATLQGVESATTNSAGS